MAERSRSTSHSSSNGSSATSRPNSSRKPPTPSRPPQSSSSGQGTKDKKSKSSLKSIRRTLSFRPKKKSTDIQIVNAQPYSNLVANGPTTTAPPQPPNHASHRSEGNSNSRFFVQDVPQQSAPSNQTRNGPTIIRPKKNAAPPRPPPPKVKSNVNGAPPSYDAPDRDQQAWASFMDEAAAAPLARQNARATSVPNLSRRPQPAPRSAAPHVTTISTLSKSSDTLAARQRPRPSAASPPVNEALLIDLNTPPGSPAVRRPAVTQRPKSMVDLDKVFAVPPTDSTPPLCNGNSVPLPAPRRTGASSSTFGSEGDAWLNNCLQGSSGTVSPVRLPSRTPVKDAPMPPLPPRPKNYSTCRSHAVALYDYQSQQDDELSFKAGDNIILINRVNPEWLYGCVTSREGMFPQNFVSIRIPLPGDENVAESGTTLPNGPCCVALFDFMGEEENELSFRSGDAIALEGRVGTEWLKGSLHGQSGLFPASYVNVVRDLTTAGGKSAAAPKSHQHGAKDGSSRCCTQGSWKYCVALYDFDGEAGEISFKEGNEFVATAEVDSDWLMGKLPDGREGRFPRNYVQLK